MTSPNVGGADNNRHHFEGWTQTTLAAHLIHGSDLHDCTVHEPKFPQLRRYRLDELEWLHYEAHVRRMREFAVANDSRFGESLKVLHS